MCNINLDNGGYSGVSIQLVYWNLRAAKRCIYSQFLPLNNVHWFLMATDGEKSIMEYTHKKRFISGVNELQNTVHALTDTMNQHCAWFCRSEVQDTKYGLLWCGQASCSQGGSIKSLYGYGLWKWITFSDTHKTTWVSKTFEKKNRFFFQWNETQYHLKISWMLQYCKIAVTGSQPCISSQKINQWIGNISAYSVVVYENLMTPD